MRASLRKALRVNKWGGMVPPMKLATLFALLLAAAASAQTYGLNPSFDAPSSRAIVFADAMERARALEPDGTRLFSDVELPAGTWVVTWAGAGEAELVGEVREVARGLGTASYAIAGGSRPLEVRWSGEVEALHVWLPGARGRAFWPPFVRAMRQLAPDTLRTLDWSLPNVPPNLRDGRLVAPALQVALVNRLGCGLHYCVPVGLSEPDLVALFHELAGVEGELVLEVGNELWNPGLWSWRWLDPQPGRLVDAAAREIDRVFAIAAREAPRARHYVGGHLANPWHLRTLLGLLAPATRVDAAGCAVYVGPRAVPATAELAAAACMARVEEVRPLLREHRAIASARGAALELYETGQSFTTGGSVVAAAQRLPAMGEVYQALGALFESEGVERACWYSFMTSQDVPSVPPFGVFESMDAPLMPKGRAVVDLMRQP